VVAFSKLVEAHAGLVRSVALRLLGPEDSQDAIQEVWIRVWRNLRSFRGDSAFSTWLYRVATNSCLVMRRNRARRKEREPGEDWMLLLAEPSGGEADPEAATLNSERSREIEVALGRVRVDHRAALTLRHMEGLSYAEISNVLGVPVGTAKGWVSRGRDALLVALTEEEARPPVPGPDH
jgi:RNA polymerase sigma-70 factor (ECF subfamily)